MRIPTLCLLPLLAAPVLAQRTFEALQNEFRAAAQKLEAQGLPREQLRERTRELQTRQIGELQKFLADEAKGDDRWNGLLMLADWQLAARDQKAAAATLQRIAKDEAPALLLVTASTMAQHLGLKELRDSWITTAMQKPAPLADRLAMARLLMTVLREVTKGEEVFTKALSEAKDDEERAFVRWQRADGLRDREDLGDNPGFTELEKLAEELPNTYWGSVAKDRLRASRLQRGDAAIDFTAKARTGEVVSLANLRGKAVALVFWSAADSDLPALLSLLKERQKQLGEQLAIVGVAIDPDTEAIQAAIQRLAIPFPVIGDGKGLLTDPALRWFVESPKVQVLDRAGKIVAMGQHAGTADARAELDEAIAQAVK